MPCFFKIVFYVVVLIVFTQLRETTCARKSRIQNYTLKERRASASMDLSKLCLENFNFYLQKLEEGTEWALKMYDSSGKPESGVLKGGHTFLGFYSECLDALPANAPALDTRTGSIVEPDFSSKYCLSTTRLTPEEKIFHKAPLRPTCDLLEGIDATFALCAPSTCNEEDVGKMAAFSLRESGCNANVTSTVCRMPIEPFLEDGPALAVAVVLTILGAVVLGATLFDRKRRKVVQESKSCPCAVDAPTYENSVPRIEQSEPSPVSCTENALLCFSLFSNGKKVFENDGTKSGSIRVLHGLRFFSMAWVICIHSWNTSVEMTTFRNVDDQSVENIKTMFVRRAVLAIDTFFFMGGLVLAYSTLKQLHKTGGKKNWLLFYAHRYLRTVPLVMVVIAIYAFMMRHFGDGPRWADFLATSEANCRVSWWTYPLYVQNFVLLDHQCLAHTWYSAVDFQFYLISPPILYALYKKPRVGVLIICILALASSTLSAVYSSVRTMRSSFNSEDYINDVYKKPYFRISPYLLGMLMGLFLSKNHNIAPPRKHYVYIGWLSCAFCLLFAIYGPWIMDPSAPTPWYGTFMVIASVLWATGIAWIVYACVSGCGGIFTSVLTSRALEPLSKLTFSTYVIHQGVVHIYFANLEGTFYYSSFLASYFFAGNLLLSYAVSVIFCLLIELPLCGIERLILPNK
ncbi:nose resistant to fluoxetine protein 6-like [Haemaphysalis longicornis]